METKRAICTRLKRCRNSHVLVETNKKPAWPFFPQGMEQEEPEEFNPLLALAGILQKMAEKKAEAAAEEEAVTPTESSQLAEGAEATKE